MQEGRVSELLAEKLTLGQLFWKQDNLQQHLLDLLTPRCRGHVGLRTGAWRDVGCAFVKPLECHTFLTIDERKTFNCVCASCFCMLCGNVACYSCCR